MKSLVWLYFGNRVLTAVLAPIGATRPEIIAKAVDSHRSVPLCAGTGYAPFEWEHMLANAEIRA